MLGKYVFGDFWGKLVGCVGVGSKSEGVVNWKLGEMCVDFSCVDGFIMMVCMYFFGSYVWSIG